MGQCMDGCGGTPKPGHDFLPGHDLRAVMAVVREHYGSARDFVIAHIDDDEEDI